MYTKARLDFGLVETSQRGDGGDKLQEMKKKGKRSMSAMTTKEGTPRLSNVAAPSLSQRF
jgi:hypothetical protein